MPPSGGVTRLNERRAARPEAEPASPSRVPGSIGEAPDGRLVMDGELAVLDGPTEIVAAERPAGNLDRRQHVVQFVRDERLLQGSGDGQPANRRVLLRGGD